jgi:hypothetical protein
MKLIKSKSLYLWLNWQKNLVYRKQIAKMINFSDNESQADVINLEDDKPNIIFGPHFEGARDTCRPFLYYANCARSPAP